MWFRINRGWASVSVFAVAVAAIPAVAAAQTMPTRLVERTPRYTLVLEVGPPENVVSSMDAMHGMAGEFLPALQFFELDQEIESDDFSAQLSDERDGGGCGPPRREEVIDDKHPFAHANGIPMDCQRVGPVFETVFDFEAVRRQFSRFPDRHEPRIQALSQDAGVNEPPRFNAHHLGHALPSIIGDQIVGDRREGLAIFEQGRDVVEENAWLGKVGNFADERSILGRGHWLRASQIVSAFSAR